MRQPPVFAVNRLSDVASCVEILRDSLPLGAEMRVFEAKGEGRLMELFLLTGEVAGILDWTPIELTATMLGTPYAAGPDRMTAAALRGIPQVIALTGADLVLIGQDVPEPFASRRFVTLQSGIQAMRTSPRECDRLGKEIAEKASASRGPTAIFIPLRGLSRFSVIGGPFEDREADAALFQSIRNHVSTDVEVVECDAHADDEEFKKGVVKRLLEMARTQSP